MKELKGVAGTLRGNSTEEPGIDMYALCSADGREYLYGPVGRTNGKGVEYVEYREHRRVLGEFEGVGSKDERGRPRSLNYTPVSNRDLEMVSSQLKERGEMQEARRFGSTEPTEGQTPA